jgi:hypothetical protein
VCGLFSGLDHVAQTEHVEHPSRAPRWGTEGHRPAGALEELLSVGEDADSGGVDELQLGETDGGDTVVVIDSRS